MTRNLSIPNKRCILNDKTEDKTQNRCDDSWKRSEQYDDDNDFVRD